MSIPLVGIGAITALMGRHPLAAIKDTPRDNRIGDITRRTLAHFEETADRVREALNEPRPNVGNVFANLNTDNAAVTHMSDVEASRVRELRALLAEPAVARIVTEDEEGEQRIYFISRATPHRSPSDGSLAVSYNASPLWSACCASHWGRGRSQNTRRAHETVPGLIVADWLEARF